MCDQKPLLADVVQVGFNPEQYSVTEGTDDFVTVCVGLDRPLERDGVRVMVSTADDSAMGKPITPHFAHQKPTTQLYV